MPEIVLGQQIQGPPHRAQRHGMFGGQGLLGWDGAARRPFAGDDARPHRGGQCAVAALPRFRLHKANSRHI